MSEVSSTHVYVSHSFYFLLPRQYIDYGHSSKYWIESLEIRFWKCVLNNAATNVVFWNTGFATFVLHRYSSSRHCSSVAVGAGPASNWLLQVFGLTFENPSDISAWRYTWPWPGSGVKMRKLREALSLVIYGLNEYMGFKFSCGFTSVLLTSNEHKRKYSEYILLVQMG